MTRPALVTTALIALAAIVPAVSAEDTPKPKATGKPAEASRPDKSDAIRASVLKVSTKMRLPDPIRPWQKGALQEASGTGLVVEGKRILTSAHGVMYASQVQVQPDGSSESVNARVVAIAPGIDLALLKLDDESFFDRRPAPPRTEGLPEIKAQVLVYGYPTGGAGQSLTKGIVSRIEFAGYAHGTSGLRVQIDAAINPGNSGGPALVNDRVIGVAYSRLGGDNIGYLIPNEEIDLFLKDVADGTYNGKPALTDSLQTLENDALKAKLGMEKAVGMVVHRPGRDDPDYPLRPWDVIVKIGDKAIDNVGMIEARDGLRLRFQVMVQRLAKDGKVPLTIVRDGKELPIGLPVDPRHDDLIPSLLGQYPSYFIYGPLAFSTATAELLSGFERAGSNSLLYFVYMGSPLVTRRGDRAKFPSEELVVVCSPMFPDRTGKGYSNPFSKVVKAVNGVPIRNLRHLVEILRDAKDRFITIDFDDRNSETIVFDRAEVLAATEEILSDNNVRQRASDDLLPIWSKK